MIEESEAKNIATLIQINFKEVISEFDYKKYPQEHYKSLLTSFSSLEVKKEDIHDALIWKWGHCKKTNFPGTHRALIHKIQENWPKFLGSSAKNNPKETFNWWKICFNGKAYITSAFITHLIHHQESIPIIDQHNFRGMNNLILQVRHNFNFKNKPSNWEDVENLARFMKSTHQHINEISLDDLDKFLMMYGKNHAKR